MSGASVPPPLQMDEPPQPPATSARPKTLADLDADSLCHAASFLSLRDISNLAGACKPLRDVAYSDSFWLRLFRERWPYLNVSCGASGIRAEYLARHIALYQLKFTDPLEVVYSTSPEPQSHILLNSHELIVSQGTSITIWNPGFSVAKTSSWAAPSAHSARITCMRLFPTVHTSSFRHETRTEDNVLITSSCDRTIRLWRKDRPKRSFRGHNGPVTTLADKFLGDCGSKLLASGGEDCTVRLWSVNSSGKYHPLLLTYHGHEKPISFLSVARHKPSLLVSIARDSRVRVWDTAAPRPSASSCVGMSTLSGAPVGMQCDGNLCYIAAGSSVTAIDLRTMDKVCSIAVHPSRIHSFSMLPSKWLICTGGEDKAMLWDMRKSGGRPEPVIELVHGGPVTLLHIDQYKVVTGGTADYHVNVWETDTGLLANSLDCRPPGNAGIIFPLSAMAVDGCRIATGGCAEESGVTYYRDFSDCMVLNSQPNDSSGSKFWDMS